MQSTDAERYNCAPRPTVVAPANAVYLRSWHACRLDYTSHVPIFIHHLQDAHVCISNRHTQPTDIRQPASCKQINAV